MNASYIRMLFVSKWTFSNYKQSDSICSKVFVLQFPCVFLYNNLSTWIINGTQICNIKFSSLLLVSKCISNRVLIKPFSCWLCLFLSVFSSCLFRNNSISSYNTRVGYTIQFDWLFVHDCDAVKHSLWPALLFLFYPACVRQVIVWFDFKGQYYSYKVAEMEGSIHKNKTLILLSNILTNL